MSGRGAAVRAGALRLVLFVTVALVTRAPFLTVPFLDLDEAAALVGSGVLLEGGTLYLDFVDNRPPLFYGYYALGQLIFGPGMVAVRLMVALFVLPLTAWAASAFFRHDRRGLVAGLLYLVYGAAFFAHDMHSVSAEVLMLLPLATAAALLPGEAEARRPGRVFAAGLLVGVAALVRQQAMLWLPPLVLAVWMAHAQGPPRRRVAGVLAILGGVFLPLVGAFGVLSAAGAGPPFLFWTLTHNVAYAASPIPPMEALERAASYLLPFGLATAPLWWAAVCSRPLFEDRHVSSLVAGLVLFSLPAAFLGFRFFPHYFIQIYWPLALAAAPWTAQVSRRPLTGPGRFALAWPLVLLGGFTLANLMLYRSASAVYEETRPIFARVARRLQDDPCYGRAPLFVWGFAPQLYTEASLSPASRFVVPQASLTGYVPGRRGGGSRATDSSAPVREEDWDLLLQDLESQPPAFVLDTARSGLHGWDRYPMEDFPRLDAFVRSGYRATADVDGVWIWRRRGCESEGTSE